MLPSELVVSWGWKVSDHDDCDSNDGEKVVVQRTTSSLSSLASAAAAAAAESNEDEDEI
jgi:hypothetical protein